jgi:hypothetical protein
MFRRVDLVRTDVSEELSASIIRVTICELGTLAVTNVDQRCEEILFLLVTANVPSSPIIVTLMMEALSSSETSIFTTATRRNIPGDTIFHSHCRVNHRSYRALTGWALGFGIPEDDILQSHGSCFLLCMLDALLFIITSEDGERNYTDLLYLISHGAFHPLMPDTSFWRPLLTPEARPFSRISYSVPVELHIVLSAQFLNDEWASNVVLKSSVFYSILLLVWWPVLGNGYAVWV